MRLRMLMREGYPLPQAIELAGGKPNIQIGLHASYRIFEGEESMLGASLESLQRVQQALERQRLAD